MNHTTEHTRTASRGRWSCSWKTQIARVPPRCSAVRSVGSEIALDAGSE